MARKLQSVTRKNLPPQKLRKNRHRYRTNVASMVDVDRRMAALSPAHAAGLRRLSARAASSHVASTAAHRLGAFSLHPLAEAVLSNLRAASVPLCSGLSELELARLEADLAFAFPPDLRALLALAIPSGPGFPDWRVPNAGLLLCLPRAAAALQVACGVLWPRSWGSRPADPARALRRARASLRRAPLLIPLFGRCYIPCLPCLAGNPVFYVDDCRVFCCAIDFSDFFLRRWSASPHPDSSFLLPRLDAARWIEFWSDAASDSRRRISSSSSSSVSDSVSSTSLSSPPPDAARFVEIRSLRVPGWVGGYLDGIGSVLRQGGWDESDIREMVHVPASRVFDGGEQLDGTDAMVDSEAALDALLVKVGRCSESLRRAGWSPEEIADALDLELLRQRRRQRCSPVKLPPPIALKLEKLLEAVARS
ncbi:hypothetical protein ZIOFF_046751 [Zingiber officinale]|uniref:Uncharacterized protein n=2 Tax=Zingiber officinale TaxID=94328 RepID=A0A8J5FNE1_ZINOF|nr:hypothetical protein ZIOFF_046751 [Zingiber officinale]